MEPSVTSPIRHPLTLAFLGIAVVGWVVAGWSLIDARSDQSRMADELGRLRRQSDQAATALKAERAASGTLADVDARRTALLGEVATAQTALRAIEQERDEARARFNSTDDNLRQLTGQQSALQQSVAQANADLDKVRTDLDAAIRHDGQVKLQTAQAENDLTAAEGQLARTVATRTAAEQAVATAQGEADALARTTATRQTAFAALQQQVEGAQTALLAAQAALPPLQAQKEGLDRALVQDRTAIDTARSEAAETGKARDAAQQDLAALQLRKAALATATAEAVRARDGLVTEAAAQSARVAAAGADAAKAAAEAEAARQAREAAATALTSLQAQGNAAARALDGATAARTDLQSEVATLTGQVDQARITLADAQREADTQRKARAAQESERTALQDTVTRLRSEAVEQERHAGEGRAALHALDDALASKQAELARVQAAVAAAARPPLAVSPPPPP